ncbi:MAG: DUF882 domain-containing protein [Deltaproteobacteria bacterium]|jgi:uncharacterized protein YcbK (DUF882 family)|nr:DUF882 domain-containing protein [Deltaproteobacteria bacterium]
MKRRDFLRAGLVWGAGLAVPLVATPSFAKLREQKRRELAFVNLHTDETLKAVYWADGRYRLDGLEAIDRVLRDHRTGDTYPMDVDLLDLLAHLRRELETTQPLHVISGYRSPATNHMLASQSDGVAHASLHVEGKAIDLRVPGRRLKSVRRAALALQAGGVGYYPADDFVHVDIGRVRRW